MHVLLCVAADARTHASDHVPEAGPADAAQGLAGALAEGWVRAAPQCTVETVVLPASPPADPLASRAGPAGAGSAGVFVPLADLGLSTHDVPARVAALRDRVARAELVVVALPALDGDTLREGPVAAVAGAAAPHATPVVVVAGRVEVTRREWSTAGVSGVHEAALDDDPAWARVARTWAPTWVGHDGSGGGRR